MTTKELIKIERVKFGNEEVDAVDARLLHTFLGSKQNFGNWIVGRIKTYYFVEGVDFIGYNNSIKAQNTYINTKEYTISIDMAKELAMVERSKKGKQARRFFIESEIELRKLKALNHENESKNPLLALNDPKTLRSMLLDYTEKVLALEQTVEKSKPLVRYAQAISGASGAVSLRDFIKTIKSDYGIKAGEGKVIDMLLARGILFRTKGKKNKKGKKIKGKLRPYGKYEKDGRNWFKLVPGCNTTSKNAHEYLQTKVTGEGQLKVGNIILEEFGVDSLFRE